MIENSRTLESVGIWYKICLRKPIEVSLEYTKSGTWWATYPVVGKFAIFGSGRTPDEAIVDFEENFEIEWVLKKDRMPEVTQALNDLIISTEKRAA